MSKNDLLDIGVFAFTFFIEFWPKILISEQWLLLSWFTKNLGEINMYYSNAPFAASNKTNLRIVIICFSNVMVTQKIATDPDYSWVNCPLHGNHITHCKVREKHATYTMQNVSGRVVSGAENVSVRRVSVTWPQIWWIHSFRVSNGFT